MNILAADQEAVARMYAGQEVEADPIWALDRAASPVLEGATAWLDCRLIHSYEGGDHTIYVSMYQARYLDRIDMSMLPRFCEYF